MPRSVFTGLAVVIAVAAGFAYAFGISFGRASLYSSILYVVASMLYVATSNRFGGRPAAVNPWQDLDMSEYASQQHLQRLFEQNGITGSANIRGGSVFPVVQPPELTGLAMRLRSSVRHMKMHKLAGADLFYMEQGVVGMADLTIMEVEQAASVIERVAEDWKLSRKLYKGYDKSELVSMARTACAHMIEKQDRTDDSDALVRAIREGKRDDHPQVRAAYNAIEMFMQIKGADL